MANEKEGHAASELNKIEVAFDVPVPMRDGVVLRADVYRPAGEEPLPVILARTPFGKGSKESMDMVEPVKTARAGFVVVVQDVRGRYASEGEWIRFNHEREDGFDSVEWAAALPGSNGRVGMLGESYCGWNQWAAASTHPRGLKAISPINVGSSDVAFYRGEVAEFGVQMAGCLYIGFDYLERLPLPPEELEQRLMAAVDEFDHLADRGYWDLPISDSPTLARLGIPPTEALTGEPAPAAIPVDITATGIDLPSLTIGGWFDLVLQGALDSFTEIAKRDTGARLLVGPWTHQDFVDPIGEGEFGVLSSRYEAPCTEFGDVLDYQREFLRAHLDPDSAAPFESKPVRYFTMGTNEWSEADTWPPEGFEHVKHFLHADGALSTESAASGEPALEFDYDPADPVPTRGGSTLLVSRYPAGPFDQTEIEERDDVLVFTSAPLEENLEVTGRVTAVLNAKSSAPSTDWVVRLCDVHPDGRSMNLCDGIIRAEGKAGEVAAYEVDLWSTSHVFLAGHSIRVDVTSSSFPRWDRNLNTGDQKSPEIEVAHQTLSLDPDSPSYVSLPVRAAA